jgi:hypothetical protein
MAEKIVLIDTSILIDLFRNATMMTKKYKL